MKNYLYYFLLDYPRAGYKTFKPANPSHKALCLEVDPAIHAIIPFFKDFSQYELYSIHWTIEESGHPHCTLVAKNPKSNRKEKLHAFYICTPNRLDPSILDIKLDTYHMQVIDIAELENGEKQDVIVSYRPLEDINLPDMKKNTEFLLTELKKWYKEKEDLINEHITKYNEQRILIEQYWELVKNVETRELDWPSFVQSLQESMPFLDKIQRYSDRQVPDMYFYRQFLQLAIENKVSIQDPQNLSHLKTESVSKASSSNVSASKKTSKSKKAKQKPSKSSHIQSDLPDNIEALIAQYQTYQHDIQSKKEALTEAINAADLESVQSIFSAEDDIKENIDILWNLIEKKSDKQSFEESDIRLDALVSIADFLYQHSSQYLDLLRLKKSVWFLAPRWSTRTLFNTFVSENLKAFQMLLRQGFDPNNGELFLQHNFAVYPILPCIISLIFVDSSLFPRWQEFIAELLRQNISLKIKSLSISDQQKNYKHTNKRTSKTPMRYSNLFQQIEENKGKRKYSNTTVEILKGGHSQDLNNPKMAPIAPFIHSVENLLETSVGFETYVVWIVYILKSPLYTEGKAIQLGRVTLSEQTQRYWSISEKLINMFSPYSDIDDLFLCLLEFWCIADVGYVLKLL